MRLMVAAAGALALGPYVIVMVRCMAVFGYVLMCVSALTLVSAADASSSPRSRALAGQIESPFCPGQTLRSCSSPAAAVWRADIRRWVDEGVSSEQIKERLSTRADRDLRTVPHNHTLTPLMLFVTTLGIAGLALVVGVMRRRRSAEEPGDEECAPASSALEDALDSRIDEELALYD